VGQLCLETVQLRTTHTFLEYVSGGTQLSCTFAIDFTGSNGDPKHPASLHYFGAGPTQYETAIRAVGGIIQDYDADGQFPVLGFGARLPTNSSVSHEFFVNMHPTSPYCAGIEGIVQAYRNCLQVVELYGPTHFAPVIDHVVQYASAYSNGEYYFIFLILTDGAICDMSQTKRALVEASYLPISVIIVGIGDADFESMDELDGDQKALSFSGRQAARDIVQFVPFRQFLHIPDRYRAGQELARALLAEIPNQLVSFMNLKNIIPKRTV